MLTVTLILLISTYINTDLNSAMTYNALYWLQPVLIGFYVFFFTI